MLKRIPVEAEAQVVYILQCKVTTSKRNAHTRILFVGGIAWLRDMVPHG